MWYHPEAEDIADRVRKTWKAWLDAREALRATPNDAARVRAESRTRSRLAEVLEGAGMVPLVPRKRGETHRSGVRAEMADGR